MPRTQPASPSPSPPPPPAELPFATGGFDFPPASASPPSAVPPRTSPRTRINQLTDFINQRHQQATDDDEEAPQRRPPTPRDIITRRRPIARSARIPRHAEREPEGPNVQRSFSRPSVPPSERYLRRAHQRVRDARSVIEDPATDVLHSLSDHPLDSFHTSRRERSPPSGLDSQRRQPKRRKLGHSAEPVSEYDGFKYGYKGQVARGRLRMEVVSCDGGEYDRDSLLYKVQNVLSNDKSVYCSQSGRCNILLRHIGDMPFCLEKMVIRAPDRGFTAPVQEGLVFVAMAPDKLLSGTSAYEIEYHPHVSNVSPPSPTPSLPGDDDDGELISFQEAMQDEAVWERSRQAVFETISRQARAEELSSMRYPRTAGPARVAQDHRDEQLHVDDDGDVINECPYHIDEGDANAAGISAPTPPPFTTTMDSEPEDSEESEAVPSAAVMADRLRRESRYRSEGEDDEAREDFIYQPPAILRRAEPLGSPRLRTLREQAQRWRILQQHTHNIEPIRAARLRTPSRIEPKHSRPEADTIIQPHARFFIARHKNKITIKFHPAISGKHVLLKLWSPTHDGNIDIESVQFYGYSGPRFFPAVQPR